MPAPIYIIIIAVSTPILLGKAYIRVKEYMEEQVSDEELDKIQPVLEELGFTLEEIYDLDTEKEISDLVKQRLQTFTQEEQIQIMDKLQKCLDQDEYFEIDYYS